jgi:hypothetical protein
MKVQKFKVPFYKYFIVSVIIESYKDKDEIIKVMKKYKMRPEDKDVILNDLEKEAFGGAYCYYNDGKLLCLIVTFPHKDAKSLVSTLLHEGRHASDKIISVTGLEGVEAAAYLSEYIQTKLILDYIKDETYQT